ncbi:GGDEF and EAL domain-containing protein [bacterium]|nr:GGDEF and EAL domain-containing protein [bacterium]MBU1994317.1 GGDEF and EAL domain-containing protein [bacterium]
MKNKNINSLSTKIVLSISLLSVIIVLIIFAVFEKMNKEAFYNIELEKVGLIANTIEPLIALNIYLDMPGNVNQLVLQLMENQNILAVKVLKHNQTIHEAKSKKYEDELNDSFIVKKRIYQPNSKKSIGTLVIIYSSKNYQELIHKYTKLLAIMLLASSLLFLLFSLYVKKLLLPLRKIANSLKNYSPNKEIKIPFASENNEIGLISNALNEMQEKISQYSKEQENINIFLEEKVTEKTSELRNQLYTDSLTGLPNRLSLLQDLANLSDAALLIINIDDFKEINDFYGHIAGDSILVEFSKRLHLMFETDNNIKLNHLAGDEFTLLFIEKPSKESLIQTVQKLLYEIEKIVFYYDNNEFSIRVSIGGTYQIRRALEKADIALKSAKKEQKPFLMYDEKLNIEEQYKDNMEWVKKLKNGIEKDKIVPYFQPIFDNVSEKCVSYECLMRLIDDNGKVIGPNNFLYAAKKSRLYSKLTKIMIEKSCKHFEHVAYDFSINLSVEDILSNDITDCIKQTIKQYNVANKIVFEILESEGIENYEEISQFISEMKALGCRIAIDDFGSGYSNFEHLLKLNIDYIKIDGTLIKNLDKDTNAQKVVETIVDFAQRLNILTIAEFVHSRTVYEKVRNLKISRTQGFFLGEPQEATNRYL